MRGVVFAVLAISLTAHAQSGLGKLDPSLPAGKTGEEIIAEVGKHESAFAKAHEN